MYSHWKHTKPQSINTFRLYTHHTSYETKNANVDRQSSATTKTGVKSLKCRGNWPDRVDRLRRWLQRKKQKTEKPKQCQRKTKSNEPVYCSVRARKGSYTEIKVCFGCCHCWNVEGGGGGGVGRRTDQVG